MQNYDWFEPDCPLCQQLMEDIKSGRAEKVEWDLEEDELDHASNHVLDLIEAGQLAAAESAARALMKQFPEAIDGVERLAGVYEAKGDYQKAIQYLESAIAFTRVHAGFDDGVRDYFRQKICELQARMP